jgi:uncharacterized membrane protein YqjE
MSRSERELHSDGPLGHEAHDPAVEPVRPDASLGELFSEFTQELGDLVRKEIELAKTEAKEEVDRFRQAAIAGAIAGVAALLALIVLSFALAWLLDEWMHPALAHGLVGLAWAVAAAALAFTARKRLAERQGLPETTTTLKEDVQWIKAQRN